MIVTPATSEGGWGGKYTVANMLAEKQMWLTKEIPSRQVESAITTGRLAQEVCVEEVAADGHRRRDAHRVELLRDVQGGAASRATTPPHNDRGGDGGDALQGLCLSARSLVMATAPASPSSAPRVPPLRRNNDSHLFSIYIRYVPSIHCWLRLIVCVKRERVHFSGRKRSRRSSLRSPPKCLPLDRTSRG